MDLHNILGVGLLVNWVFFDQSLRDVDADRNLEEMGPVAVSVVFVASLHMGKEDFRGVEHLAEFALHTLAVLEYSCIDLRLAQLLVQHLVLVLNF